MYAIVTFTKTNDVAIVSTSWLCDDEASCYWPPYLNSVKLEKAARQHEAAGSNWKLYAVRKVNVRNGMVINLLGLNGIGNTTI